MFDWSGKNADKSGKSQGILISCVSGNPVHKQSQNVWILGGRETADDTPVKFHKLIQHCCISYEDLPSISFNENNIDCQMAHTNKNKQEFF